MGYYTLAEAAASSVSMLQAARNGSLAARSRSGSLRRTRSSSVAMATAAAGAAADSRLQEQAGAEDVGEGEPPPVKRPRRGSAASAPQLQSSQGMDGIPSMSLSMAATASMGLEGSGVGTGEGSEAGEEESGPPCPLWVECHLCKKWRRVPHNYPVCGQQRPASWLLCEFTAYGGPLLKRAAALECPGFSAHGGTAFVCTLCRPNAFTAEFCLALASAGKVACLVVTALPLPQYSSTPAPAALFVESACLTRNWCVKALSG